MVQPATWDSKIRKSSEIPGNIESTIINLKPRKLVIDRRRRNVCTDC